MIAQRTKTTQVKNVAPESAALREAIRLLDRRAAGTPPVNRWVCETCGAIHTIAAPSTCESCGSSTALVRQYDARMEIGAGW